MSKVKPHENGLLNVTPGPTVAVLIRVPLRMLDHRVAALLNAFTAAVGVVLGLVKNTRM